MKLSVLAIASLATALVLAGCATESTTSAPATNPSAPAVVPAAAPAAPAKAAAPAPKKVSFNSRVYFNDGKVTLSSKAKSDLDELLAKLNGHKVVVIIAVGHTDHVGAAEAKQKRGLAEANAVKDYLVSKGIVANQVYVDSKGDKEPAASNKKAEGRSRNRRVEIEAIGFKPNS
jgi:OOP family OmpA-OmpF porin